MMFAPPPPTEFIIDFKRVNWLLFVCFILLFPLIFILSLFCCNDLQDLFESMVYKPKVTKLGKAKNNKED